MPRLFSQTSTALCVAVVAIVASVAAVAGHAQTSETRELQGNVDRLYDHLKYRGETDEGPNYFKERVAALSEVLDAWNASARSDEDAQRMRDWLQAAIRSSMHGSEGPLPAAPTFSQPMPEPAVSPRTQVADAAPRADRPAAPTRPPQRPTRAAQPPARPDTPDWDDHPAMAELAWGNPFQDDPPRDAAPGDTRVASRRAVDRFKPVVNAPADVKLDLAALAERVRGYNARLRELEGVLAGSRNPSAFRIAAVVRDLDDLSERREFLGLYLAGLSARESSSVPPLGSAESALRLTADAAERRAGEIQGAASESADAERAVLAAVSRKLKDLRSALVAGD